MKRFALKYSNTVLSSFIYNSADTKMLDFEGTEVTYPIPNTQVETGRNLNGKKYSHKLYTYKSGRVVISPNELNSDYTSEIPSGLEFLIAFWNAPFKYITFFEDFMPDIGNYIQIDTNGGAFPVEYIDGIKYLPEVTIEYEFTNTEA